MCLPECDQIKHIRVPLEEKDSFGNCIYAVLGVIPTVTERENRDILAALAGVKMGSGKKASTYNWFRNRLADTQGAIVPRSVIDIFAKAAKKEELRNGKAGNMSKSIIRLRCFEDVLPEVSEKRVTDIKEEFVEYASF